jgi:hypothetical protein
MGKEKKTTERLKIMVSSTVYGIEDMLDRMYALRQTSAPGRLDGIWRSWKISVSFPVPVSAGGPPTQGPKNASNKLCGHLRTRHLHHPSK